MQQLREDLRPAHDRHEVRVAAPPRYDVLVQVGRDPGAGDRDVEDGAVSFRYRDGRQDNGVPKADAVARIAEAVEQRVQV